MIVFICIVTLGLDLLFKDTLNSLIVSINLNSIHLNNSFQRTEYIENEEVKID